MPMSVAPVVHVSTAAMRASFSGPPDSNRLMAREMALISPFLTPASTEETVESSLACHGFKPDIGHLKRGIVVKMRTNREPDPDFFRRHIFEPGQKQRIDL